MQFKTLATFLFAALAVANPAPEPQAPGDIGALLGNIPTSIINELMTAIPPSVIQAFANPTAASSMIAEIAQGNIPAWYSALPADVRAELSSLAMPPTGMPTPTGSGPLPTATAATATATATTTGTASTTETSTSSAANASATSTSTSTGGAAATTGAVALGFAGAAGILGLALAL
jgi:hypothetical protein